jgi:hypothetical protein
VVREVVARAVLGSVGKRLAAPWFYAQLALKLLGAPGEPLPWRKGKGEGKTASREPITPRKILDTARRAYIALATGLTVLYTLGAWLVAFMREAPPPQRRYTRVADGPMALARTLIGIDGRSGLAAPTWPTRLVFAAVEVLVALLSPVLDRLGPALAARALTAKTGLRVVDLVERILFPDGWPSPPPIEPTPEEARVLDAQFRRRVDEVLPAFVKRAITAVPGENAADALVDIVSDYECNAHLVALLLPAIVAALVPELLAHEPEKPLITEPIVENTPTDTIDIHDQ